MNTTEEFTISQSRGSAAKRPTTFKLAGHGTIMQFVNYLSSAIYRMVALTAIGSSLAVFVVRGQSVFHAPGFVSASGLEGAGAYGIYKACRGEALYHDFSSESVGMIFNFGFYQIYGHIVRQFGDCAWATPMVGRAITVLLLLTLAGMTLLFFLAPARLVAQVFIASALVSPAIGWWAFALRPDIAGVWALGAAILAAIGYIRTKQKRWIMLCVAFGFLAWGFKQTFLIFSLAIVALTIFAGGGMWFVGGCILAAGVVVGLLYALLGSDYWVHTVGLPGAHPLMLDVAIGNMVTAGLKGFVIWSSFILLLFFRNRQLGQQCMPRDEKIMLLIVGGWLVFSIATSAKVGASDNYFFPVVLAVLVYELIVVCRLSSLAVKRVVVVAGTASILMNGVVLAGLSGRLVLSPVAGVAEVNEVLKTADSPRLVWDERVALPWVTPNADQRIFDSYIDLYQASTIPGRIPIEKLVKEGFYSVIVMPVGSTHFDLQHYSSGGAYGTVEVFVRKRG